MSNDGPHPNSWRARPELVAAIVNGLIVLVVPPLLIFLSQLGGDKPSRAIIPGPPTPVADFLNAMAMTAMTLVPFSPFALVAFLRTYEHVKRALDKRGRALQGVVEAGALGLVVPLLILAPAIVKRPTHPDAIPYVSAYCVLGVTIGLSLGLILWLTGSLALRVASKGSSTV